jgi:hypothetical protein
VGEREIGRFEIGVSGGPVLPSIYREVDGRELYEIENVAVRLALPPFNFHYGTGDDRFDSGGGIDRGVQDRDVQWIGGDGRNEYDLTNLEWWVRGEMFITLEARCEEYIYDWACEPVSGGARERGDRSTHYQFNGFWYPKTGKRALLHRSAAKDGGVICNRKELEVMEKGVQSWLAWQDKWRVMDLELNVPQIRRFWLGNEGCNSRPSRTHFSLARGGECLL